MPRPDDLDSHQMAIYKMEAAYDLTKEAYGLWGTAEIRRAGDRISDSIDELKEMDVYLKEQRIKRQNVVDVHLPDPS